MLAFQAQVRLAVRMAGLGGVLGVVEHKHVVGHGLGGDEVGVLGHVPRAVHLPLVVDLLHNLRTGLGSATQVSLGGVNACQWLAACQLCRCMTHP